MSKAKPISVKQLKPVTDVLDLQKAREIKAVEARVSADDNALQREMEADMLQIENKHADESMKKLNDAIYTINKIIDDFNSALSDDRDLSAQVNRINHVYISFRTTTNNGYNNGRRRVYDKEFGRDFYGSDEAVKLEKEVYRSYRPKLRELEVKREVSINEIQLKYSTLIMELTFADSFETLVGILNKYGVQAFTTQALNSPSTPTLPEVTE